MKSTLMRKTAYGNELAGKLLAMRGEVLELLDEVVAEVAGAGDGLLGSLDQVGIDGNGLVVDIDDERLSSLDDRLDSLGVS